jgi:hypothetical protein
VLLTCPAKRCTSATQLPAMKPSYYLQWASGLVLSSGHFQVLTRMEACSLESLHIADCSLLHNRNVAVLASAAPGLRLLRLEGAARLTDSALYALLGCLQLVCVRVGGAEKVQADGVVVLLMMLQKLQEVSVAGQQVPMLVAGFERCMVRKAVAAKWTVAHGSAGQWATWKRVLPSSSG